MPIILHSTQFIGQGYPWEGYPSHTGRLIHVYQNTEQNQEEIRFAFIGDSTIDNGYWVQKGTPYAQKTATVTYQTAVAMAEIISEGSFYTLANFAVDGATTEDLTKYIFLNKVIPRDEDHIGLVVNQLEAMTQWSPHVVVMSVGGNNYREALLGTLGKKLSISQLFFRQTPDETKPDIKQAFEEVKQKLLTEYKAIIDKLIEKNPQMRRLVLMSQYYPELTDFTPYFIYTGFSHIARAQGKNQNAFNAIETSMNELYREIMHYVADKNKEVVFVDVTSSLNPLDNNHTRQIEPNARGAAIMGKLIASAVNYQYPKDLASDAVTPVAMVRMDTQSQQIHTQLMSKETITDFSVKPLSNFIAENRYRHIPHFFSPSSDLATRYESAYHMVMGKQFDSEYCGRFAFGLLDVSLVTIFAAYLYRVAINEQNSIVTRIGAGAVAAPVLSAKALIGIIAMLLLSIPIYGYHEIAQYFDKESSSCVENSFK